MNLKAADFSPHAIEQTSRQLLHLLEKRTKRLKRVKHYAATTTCVIIILTVSVIKLTKQGKSRENENQQLLNQIAQLKEQVPVAPKENKVSQAQVYVQAIQGKLQKINDYLSKRGLKTFSTKGIIGDSKTPATKLSDTQIYSEYNDYLGHFIDNVADTPMGYPRISPLTSYFGYRSNPFDGEGSEFHPGIDFRGKKGDPVKCTASGRVVFAGRMGGYGNCIRIKHINNLETLYGHLSRINVRVGQRVSVGDKIGLVGSTGRSTGTHLHYEIRKNGKPVNPIKYLALNS
jgi:murein DD-endopeptidase MepM/ murein hydrolase activator NlpD